MQRRTVVLVRSTSYGWLGLGQLLVTLSSVSVVAEMACQEKAIQFGYEHKPDVIVAAASISQRSTVPLLRAIRVAAAPASKILVVADRFEANEMAELADIGLSRHLLWSDVTAETFPQLLAAILSGNIVVASRAIADAFVAVHGDATYSDQEVPKLDPRSRRVLRQLADDRTHGEIARAEGVSARTVERIVTELKIDLDAPNQFVMGLKAIRSGLLCDDSMAQW